MMPDAVELLKELLKKYLAGIHPVEQDRKLPSPEILRSEAERYE